MLAYDDARIALDTVRATFGPLKPSVTLISAVEEVGAATAGADDTVNKRHRAQKAGAEAAAAELMAEGFSAKVLLAEGDARKMTPACAPAIALAGARNLTRIKSFAWRVGYAGLVEQESQMQIGYVSVPGKGATDACLAEAVAILTARSVPMAGTVQTNLERQGRTVCDMDVRVLPDGPVLRISQDLGAGARGCRLDGGALEAAVAEAALRMTGAALFVVNKFGKQEAMGRGLVPLIAESVGRGLPVLVGVNGLNLPAFLAFAEGLAEPLPADPAAIAAWALNAVLVDA